MPDRGGNQCVGPGTMVLVRETTRIAGGIVTKVFEKPIEQIECLFNLEDVPGEPGRKAFVQNANYDTYNHRIMTVNSTPVTPLYRYEGDEKIPLWEISAIIPPEDPLAAVDEAAPGFTLLTTEWHPIMRNQNSVTFASLLTRGDSVLLIDGIGIVKSAKRVDLEPRPRVYGLALGDRTIRQEGEALLDGLALQVARNVQLESLISTQMRNWGTFGLPIKEQIIFTGKFATGGLAIQNQLSEILSNGINLNNFV